MSAVNDLVLLERSDDGVAILTLNRPEKHNALSDALMERMAEHLITIQRDEGVRVLVVTGAGERAFCAGRDMTEGVNDGRRERTSGRPGPFSLLLQLEIPTIAAVNGYAFGGGALLALMCDLRVAAQSATIRFPGSAYGLAVGAGLLASVIGPSAAKDLIFTTRVVSAHEALALGLVNYVAEGDAKVTAREIAAGIARNSPAAMAASKRLIDRTVRAELLMQEEAEENRNLRTADQAGRFRAAAEAVTKKRVGS